MVMFAAAAVVSAPWICAAVGGWAVSINQPPVSTVFSMPSMWIACSVRTMFGAEVPEGSAPTCWTSGFFKTPGFAHNGLIGSARAQGAALWRLNALAPGQVHAGDAGEAGATRQDVGVRVHFRRTDPESSKELRSCDGERTAAEGLEGRRRVNQVSS